MRPSVAFILTIAVLAACAIINSYQNHLAKHDLSGELRHVNRITKISQ
jgi:hypothetical protein